jgi:hypothetical protein
MPFRFLCCTQCFVLTLSAVGTEVHNHQLVSVLYCGGKFRHVHITCDAQEMDFFIRSQRLVLSVSRGPRRQIKQLKLSTNRLQF